MENKTDVVDLHGKIAVAAVDFHSTRIYALDQDSHDRPETVTAEDPRNFYHNVYHRAGNPDGTYEADNDAYWKLLCESLHAADGIVLLTNGTGKANAGHHFSAYAEKHFSSVSDKILGEVRCDISDLTDPQLLRIGQDFMGIHPKRDHGDSRRGAN
jgi:hypothetical protein